MSDVETHYQRLLAPIYSWMGGGIPQKVADNCRFFESIGIVAKPPLGKALDLGCGSGFQALALASLGFSVVGVDTSEELLAELAGQATAQPVLAIQGDLRDRRVWESHGPFDVVVCMGDSLIHLSSIEDIRTTLMAVHDCLDTNGRFIATFRDLTFELCGSDRAIPVKLDDERLMATFLEYEPQHVVVNDMVFQRREGKWDMQTSSYKKLRLSAQQFAECLNDAGFHEIRQTTERGFCTTIAEI